MKWPEPGYRNSGRSKNGTKSRAATSEMRCAPLRDAHANGGFALWVGLWEAWQGRSRRRWCAAVRFDAAKTAHGPLGKVVCRAPPATAVVEPGFLAHSTHFEPKAVGEASEAVDLACLTGV
jgi:hypothetical protein